MTPPADDEVEGSGSLRIDKWLWYARLVKSRTLATALVSAGHVRVNRQRVEKPSQPLRPGDVITATLGRDVRTIEVLALGHRRGPAPEARALYEELTPRPVAPQSGAAGGGNAAGDIGRREPGAGRPTKRERRQLDRFKDGIS